MQRENFTRSHCKSERRESQKLKLLLECIIHLLQPIHEAHCGTFHSQVKLIHWKQTQPQDLEQVFHLRTDGIRTWASKYQKRTHPNVCQNIMGGVLKWDRECYKG